MLFIFVYGSQVDMKKDTRDLTDASLASDEESLMRTPQGVRKKNATSAKKRISAPTTYPSNFSTVR